MALNHICWCSASFELSDDKADTDFKCPQCGLFTRVKPPNTGAFQTVKETLAPPSSGFPVDQKPVAGEFLEPAYFIRQRIFSFQEEYSIQDTAQKPFFVVKRPRYLFFRYLSLFVIVFLCIVGMAFSLRFLNQYELSPYFIYFMFPPIFVLAVTVGILMRPKRHISFYLKEAKEKLELTVFQNSKIMMIHTKFTVADENNQTIGRIEKNNFSDFLRKKWRCFDSKGDLLFFAVEDSLILSLLRRVIGNFWGLLRTHFIFVSGDSHQVFGDLLRQFTLRDRYYLKWNTDVPILYDRRLLLATAILLDTGERR